MGGPSSVLSETKATDPPTQFLECEDSLVLETSRGKCRNRGHVVIA